MKILLFPSFEKRYNSTKIPNMEDGFEFDVSLKSGSVSRHSPVLILSQPYNTTYTYAWFNDSWFYIDLVVSLNHAHSEIHLREDPIASARDIIMSTPNYCLRSSVYSNGKIIDSQQPVEFPRYYVESRIKFLDAVSPDQGYKIINIYGRSGADCYYIGLDGADEICEELFSQKQSDLWDAIKGSLTGEITQMINLEGYINDLYVLPFNPTVGASQSLYLGFFNTGVSGQRVRAICKEGVLSIAIPHPPYDGDDITTSSQYYQRSSKYVSYMLYIPCCGTYQIDADLLGDEDTLYFIYYVDSYGNISGHIATNVGAPILFVNGNCAYRYAIGKQQSRTYAQVASAAVGSAITFNGGGVESALASAVPTGGTVIGGSGNAAAWRVQNGDMVLTMFWRKPAPGLTAVYNGYPVYAQRTPSSPGYYLFKNAQISSEGWDDREIVSVLNSGIYIE